ncbi:DUF6415 family natural product biosynthesis protein [Streptomyces sp. NPDC050610]|uniref:DUF6415 family natural product biosynthesis protein n=1 Tax=Streptomyces sp. NPDC050610 TaxID=3157097 RepID=UPI00344152BE
MTQDPRTITRSPDVDLTEIKTVVNRALAERPAPLAYEVLFELHQELVRHIRVLTPLAQKRVDGQWRGSVEWYNDQTRMNRIAHELGEGLGNGLMSAASHVQALGYTLQFLVQKSETAARATQTAMGSTVVPCSHTNGWTRTEEGEQHCSSCRTKRVTAYDALRGPAPEE